MNITKVAPLMVELPFDTWSWVKVETECGITGWGEYSGNPITHAAVTAILQVLGRQMVGKDPLRIGDCLEQVRGWRYPSFLDDRMVMMAVSALDMALWDIRAKAEGVPMRALFHGEGGAYVPLYANLNRVLRKKMTMERLLDAAEAAVEDGFEMVKLAPFSEVTPLTGRPDVRAGAERCRAVGARVGLERLSVDCHCRFTLSSFGMMLEELGEDRERFQFFEDPVRIHFDRDVAPVKARWPGLRLASGEDCFSAAELMDLAQGGHLSILNPDVKYIGGVSAAVELVPRLRAHGPEVCFHNPSGPVATAHSAQLSVLCGAGTSLEFAFGGGEARGRSVAGGEPVERGRYYLTDRPGLGVEPDPEFLEKYAREAL